MLPLEASPWPRKNPFHRHRATVPNPEQHGGTACPGTNPLRLGWVRVMMWPSSFGVKNVMAVPLRPARPKAGATLLADECGRNLWFHNISNIAFHTVCASPEIYLVKILL